MRITVDIPEEILTELAEFKKRQSIADDNVAICRLIESALLMPEYFRYFNWAEAEQEAEGEIKLSKTKSFDTVDDFLTELNS